MIRQTQEERRLERVKAILKDLLVPRIDAVFQPANRRRFLLLKEEVKRMPDVAVEAECSALTEQEKEAIKAALAKLYPLWEENKLPEAVIAELSRLVGYPAPGEKEKPYPYPAAKELHEALKALKGNEEVEKAIASLTTKLEDERKGYVAEIAKAQSQIAELQKALEAERTAREKRDFESQISGSIQAVASLAGDGFVSSLFDVKKSLGDEKWNQLFEVLKKLNSLVNAVPVTKELGSSVSVEESPEEILAKRAQAQIEKGLAKTIEQARAQVLEQDHDLYRRLRGR